MIRARRKIAWLVAIGLLLAVGHMVGWVWTTHSMRSRNKLAWLPDDNVSNFLPAKHTLIFAPHPDDETLGCGGYIQRAVSLASKIHVVLVTNGEYPEMDVLFFERKLPFKPQAFIELGYRRQQETLRALRFLGCPKDEVTFLGFPNHYIENMWMPEHWLSKMPVMSARTRSSHSPYDNSMIKKIAYSGDSLLESVEAILLREKPNAVITPHPDDMHHDHWPVYAVVRFALSELENQGQTWARDCQVYTYLIHQDCWPVPRGYNPHLNLQPPVALLSDEDTNWQVLSLSESETIRKHQAITLYQTQLGRYNRLLQSFARKDELFGVIKPQCWSLADFVEDKVVIRDGTVDTTTSARLPETDITTVRLTRYGRKMSVSISTRSAPTKKIGYHLSLHAGGTTPDDRLVATFHWRDTKARGCALVHGQLRELPQSGMKVSVDGCSSVLTADWPLEDNKQSFFLLRAWTTRGSRLADQTETAVFRIVDDL